MLPLVVDLFSGCGGFALGAEWAGFRSAVAVDIDADLQSSYKINFPHSSPILSDISLLNADSWRLMLSGRTISGVIGGPPCQGFSRIGKRDVADPRRGLLFHFFRNVAIIGPSFFVMENVEGLLDPANRGGLDSSLELVAGDYKILGPIVVNAADYGAPTSRRRAIVIGYKENEVADLGLNDFLPRDNVRPVYVKDAIRDLPDKHDDLVEGNVMGWGRYKPGRPSSYARAMRAGRMGLTDGLSEPEKFYGMVSGCFPTKHTNEVIKRFSETAQGCVEPVSRYPRLAWDGLCPTLRAGTGKDRGNFQAARPIHPEKNRVITVREAARLQGFPDDFIFHSTIHHSFRMIGNSVSPIFAHEILSVLGRALKRKDEEGIPVSKGVRREKRA